jgi:hypothetical protein
MAAMYPNTIYATNRVEDDRVRAVSVHLLGAMSTTNDVVDNNVMAAGVQPDAIFATNGAEETSVHAASRTTTSGLPTRSLVAYPSPRTMPKMTVSGFAGAVMPSPLP